MPVHPFRLRLANPHPDSKLPALVPPPETFPGPRLPGTLAENILTSLPRRTLSPILTSGSTAAAIHPTASPFHPEPSLDVSFDPASLGELTPKGGQCLLSVQ
eukprot:6062053-Heterocapsa_arctica.AAC.1